MKRRIIGLAISILFFCVTFLNSPFSINADSTKLVKIISKDPSIVGLCFANGISIIETYETFFLTQIQDQQEEIIKELGFQYEIIPDSNKIKFGGYEFISKDDKTFSYPNQLDPMNTTQEKHLYIVQCIGPIKQEWKDVLNQFSIITAYSMDQFGLLIQTNYSTAMILKTNRFIKAIGMFPDTCKISPMIDLTQEKADLEIVTTPHFLIDSLQDSLQDPFAQYYYAETSSNGSLAIINLSSILIPKLVKNQDIILINPKGKPLEYNAEASQVLNINDNADQNQISGLKGAGEIVGVADTGLSSGNAATIHPAFKNPTFADKVVATYPATGWGDANGHGTHVCGSILGTGAGDVSPYAPRYKGMAPEAKLVFQNAWTSYGNNPIYTILHDAYNSGARIHSNSWSNQNNSWGQYDTDAMSIDQLMWDHMDMQVLFAAGNSRSNSQYGVWPPANNGTHTLTNFCGAKNGITVGASQNKNTGYFFNRMAYFSSVGPTHDGRIKPDVIAPGHQIRSTYYGWVYLPPWTRSNTYRSMSGTSMATPITAGSLTLIRECFRKTYGLPSSEIPASLIKASMINGCNTSNVYDDVSYNAGPQLFLSRTNYISGFGRVDVKNSTFPSDKNWIFYNEYASNGTRGLKQGELSKKYYIYSYKNDQPFKATLVWTDMPGTACSYNFVSGKGMVPDDYYDPTPELVNDLDITIRKYNSTSELYIGNQFDPTGFSQNLPSVSYDSVNNVEVINIQNPSLGVYEIEVSSYRKNIQSDAAHNFRQPYSLVVSGAGIVTTNPPPPPISIHGNTTCGSNELGWTEGFTYNNHAVSYRITRIAITGPNAGETRTFELPATQLTYSDSAITIGIEYFYYIQAINDKGMISDNSTGIQLGLIIPPKAISFYPPLVRSSSVVLYWNIPWHGTCPIGGFYVYRSNTNNNPGALISQLLPPSQLAFADTSIHQGETWYYSVVTVDTHGFVSDPSRQIKVTIPFDQTNASLSAILSKQELCQGDSFTIKITLNNHSATQTNSLKVTFLPTQEINYKNSDKLTGIQMQNGSIEFNIGVLPALGNFTFSLFCQQDGVIQFEKSIKQFLVLSDQNGTIDQTEFSLYLKKCGGGNQGSINISSKVLNLSTDPETGERYIKQNEELKLLIEFSGGVAPYQLKISWGDGASDVKKLTNTDPLTLKHTYSSNGTMNIQIEITDSSGSVKSISFIIKVK